MVFASSKNKASGPISGFILTRARREIAGKLCLEYWLNTSNGAVKLITDAQDDVFFIAQQDFTAANELLAGLDFRYRPLELATFEHLPVGALCFSSGATSFKAKQILEGSGVTLYEADIRLTDRYLMERFIYGSAQFNGVHNATASQKFQSYSNAHLKPANYTPSLKVLSIDIECS